MGQKGSRTTSNCIPGGDRLTGRVPGSYVSGVGSGEPGCPVRPRRRGLGIHKEQGVGARAMLRCPLCVCGAAGFMTK